MANSCKDYSNWKVVDDSTEDDKDLWGFSADFDLDA